MASQTPGNIFGYASRQMIRSRNVRSYANPLEASRPHARYFAVRRFLAAPAKFATETDCRNSLDVGRTCRSLVPRELQIGPTYADF